MPYFTLISRPKSKPGWRPQAWEIQFGAHDRADVVAERLGIRETDRRHGEKREYRIVRTATSNPALVHDVIRKLTTDLPPPKPRGAAAQAEAR